MTLNWNKEQLQAISDISDWVKSRTGPKKMSLTGAAGVGKTSVLVALKDVLSSNGMVSWTAMTGKAALRVTQTTGMAATTLHSQLYTRPKIGKRGALLFEVINMDKRPDVLIIDESSMITPKIMKDLDIWVEKGTKILFVGDPIQLPPVMSPEEEKEYGSDFSVFSHVSGPMLLKVMRSDDDIVRVATKLREENIIPFKDEGCYSFKMAQLPDKMAVDQYISDPEDHAVITWRNKLRMQANIDIRKRLGIYDVSIQPNEPVMICKNGQTVLNGEVHKTVSLTRGPMLGGTNNAWLNIGATKILVNVDGREQKLDGMMPFVKDWHRYRDDLKKGAFEEPIPITYGYVFTAHKVQGSEFRRVTIFLSRSDMENDNFKKPTKLPTGQTMAFATRWLYTSLTRAKKQVTLILGSQ